MAKLHINVELLSPSGMLLLSTKRGARIKHQYKNTNVSDAKTLFSDMVQEIQNKRLANTLAGLRRHHNLKAYRKSITPPVES